MPSQKIIARKLTASVEQIESRIFIIREQRVMLDADLAELYGVETRRLNEQVSRNSERFPEDFMFQLTDEEFTALRSQFVTLKSGRWQHRKYMPYAFTEHGAHGHAIAELINAIRQLMTPSATEKKRPIVFAPWKEQ